MPTITTAIPTTPGSFTIEPAADRGFADHGWLQTHHSFSFADYADAQKTNWGALRVFNDDTVAPGTGFGTHPHRDMEILTYVLEGELEHRDSMGNVGIVRPGGVQYLSAGTGIRHSEYNHSADHPVRFVQMWVVPHAANLQPRYGQVDYTLADRQDRWLTIASGRAGAESKIAIWQDAVASVARVERATLDYALEAGRFGFAFVATGEVAIGGRTLRAGDSARIVGPADLRVSGDGEIVLWDVPDLE